jgi:hypothetical protein
MLAASARRAKIFLGTAICLADDKARTFDEGTSKLVRQEVARITAAVEVSKPDWLGAPDPGFVTLDYSRFRPRGFYTRSPQLERYFRAISWLQAIPFRVKNEEELLAALILSRAAVVPPDAKFLAARRGRTVLSSLGDFFGSGDDWGLDVLERYHQDIEQGTGANERGKSIVAELRADLLKRAKEDQRPQINDHLAFIPDDPGAVAEVTIRVAPPFRLPDAVLLQRTTDPRRFNRPWPSGLDVASGLGSAHARRHLAKAGGKELLARIDSNKALLVGPDGLSDEYSPSRFSRPLYAEYLACLATLATTVEPDWPIYMKGEAWQAKTCQTVLAGWSQMRHTWVLQAKLSVTYLSRSPRVPGFVEPVPEFYRELGRLCQRITLALNHAGAFADDDRVTGRKNQIEREMHSAGVVDIDEALHILERSDLLKQGAAALRKLSTDERTKITRVTEFLGEKDLAGQGRPEQFQILRDRLRKERDKLIRQIDEEGVALASRWQSLRECCARLECLSHKQLRGRDFATEEEAYLRRFGELLAWLMFYEGNSYLSPHDDAPRVVEVFARGSQLLEVGIARPRAIYVLYPWQGQEVLCRGAVLPYHEFIHGERLTDEAWRCLINTRNRPAQPTWLMLLTKGANR